MRLIDADAAIDTLNEQIEQCNKALGSFDISLKDEYAIKVERASLEAYKEQLENMPSAQPERKPGRWIPDDSELEIKCNKCGKSFSNYVNAGTGYVFLEETPNFCPNCGADMRGEQE